MTSIRILILSSYPTFYHDSLWFFINYQQDIYLYKTFKKIIYTCMYVYKIDTRNENFDNDARHILMLNRLGVHHRFPLLFSESMFIRYTYIFHVSALHSQPNLFPTFCESLYDLWTCVEIWARIYVTFRIFLLAKIVCRWQNILLN